MNQGSGFLFSKKASSSLQTSQVCTLSHPQVTSRSGHCHPQDQPEGLQSKGMVPQGNWAWRPTQTGHGSPEDIWTGCGGQDVPKRDWQGAWQNASFLTGVQTNLQSRLWQPQGGSQMPQSGKTCNGMQSFLNTAGNGNQLKQCPAGPFYLRLRRSLSWWQQHNKNPQVMGLINNGVSAAHALPSKLSMVPCKRSQSETSLAWETVQEYLEVGALKEVKIHQAKHLIPWFVIQKGEKLRLITNCKEINQYLEPKPFRLEIWPEMFAFLRKGM